MLAQSLESVLFILENFIAVEFILVEPLKERFERAKDDGEESKEAEEAAKCFEHVLIITEGGINIGPKVFDILNSD